MAEAFAPGAEVEVQILDKGFYGAWFEAKVLSRFSLSRYVKYKVQYLNLLRDDGSNEPLVEDVYSKNVRPRAPRRLHSPSSSRNEDEDPNFKMHDLVEAYYNDGWWHGVLLGLRDSETGLYTVSFPISREALRFKPDEIRPKLAFINSKWVPISGEEQTKGIFKEGDSVEVSRWRDDYGQSYFLAQVEKVIHNSYFLVKYKSPYARPNGDLTEIVDPCHLRPAYRGSKTNPFMVDSSVEFFVEGGWSPGVVSSCLSGSNYAVTYENKGESITELFNVSDLRWRMRKRGRPSKENKRKSANSDKTCTSDVSLTERSEITPDSVISGGKKMKVDRSEEIQEVQSPLQHKITARMDLDSEDEVPINDLYRVRSDLSKSNSSSCSKNMHAVRKISESRKMLTELKECHFKITTGKRSSACKRNLNGWKIDKILDEVNNKSCATSEMENNVDLSNESSSDLPQLNKDCEKEAADVGTISCEEHCVCNTNDAADLAGEDPVRILFHDTTVGHIKGSENQCLLNEQDSLTDGVADISKGQLVNSQPIISSAMKHLQGSQDKISNPRPSSPVSRVDQQTLKPLLENSVLTEPNHNSNFNKHTLAENTPVKLVSSDIALSFGKNSPIWKTLEALELFNRIPQMPHFKKLKSKCEEEREGQTIGMMVTYARLAQSIQSLPNDTEVTVFEKKIAILDSLEENGFIVDPMRNRLQYLLEIKTNCTKTAMKRAELVNELANKEQVAASLHLSAKNYKAELEDIGKSISELEEKKKVITKSIFELEEKEKDVTMKRANVISSAADYEHSLSSMSKEIVNITRSLELSLEEFVCARSKPLI